MFLRVISNPIWLGVTGTTVTEQTIVSAYLTYAAKYLQAQFRIPAHLASIHTGKCTPAALWRFLLQPPQVPRGGLRRLLSAPGIGIEHA